MTAPGRHLPIERANGQRRYDVGDTPELVDWRMYYVRDDGDYRHPAGRVDRLGEIDQFAKATFVLRLNDVGSFVIDADPQATGVMAAINDIPYGDQARHVELVINGRRVFLGPVQGYERRLDTTHETVTLFGNDQNVWLAQRICLPRPEMGGPYFIPYSSPPLWTYPDTTDRPWCGAYQRGYADRQGSNDFTGPAGQAITFYVYNNLGRGSLGAIWSTSAAEQGRCRLGDLPLPGPAIGATYVGAARFQSLLEYVQAIALGAGDWPLAFQVQAWGLNVWQPTDRGAVFSTDLGNVKSFLGRWSADDVNTTYTAGQGEHQERQVVVTHGYGHPIPLQAPGGQPTGPTLPVYDDLAYPPIFGRVETFRDRRDTDDWAVLKAAGVADCRAGIKRPQATVAALDTPTQRFGRDYELGDIVTVRFAGADIKVLVTGLTFSLEPGQPPTVTPTLGTEVAVAPLEWVRRLNNTGTRLNQLERR